MYEAAGIDQSSKLLLKQQRAQKPAEKRHLILQNELNVTIAERK